MKQLSTSEIEMIAFKKIDDFLMSFLTSLRYPKSLKTPFSRFLFAVGFNLLMIVIFVSPDFIEQKVRWLTYILVPPFLLAIFYHWRLWQQQEKSGKSSIENL